MGHRATHVNISALRSSLRLSWLGWQRVDGDVVTREMREAAPASVTPDMVEKPAADEPPPAARWRSSMAELGPWCSASAVSSMRPWWLYLLMTSPGARRGGPVAFHLGCTSRPVLSVRSVPGRRLPGEAERARDVLALAPLPLPLPPLGLSFLVLPPLGLALRLGLEAAAAPSPPSPPSSPPLSAAFAFLSFFSCV